MNTMMTKKEALEIQAKQVTHYGKLYCGGEAALRAKIASMTISDALEDDISYPISIINRCIPRGGSIEYLCGITQPNLD